MELVDHFINAVSEELDHLNGSDFEALCLSLIELITGNEFELKGHNLEMKPVKGSVDLIQNEGFKVIGQCGTDSDYFSGDKPINDIESSITNSPDFKTIYLFCNRRAKGNEFQTTKSRIWNKLKEKLETGFHYHLYDGQQIAKTIFRNIWKAEKVEEILHYLPKAYEYYLLLPQSNILPLPCEDYVSRQEEEEVIRKLETIDFLQIYGLSGIGKSQLSIAIAEKLHNQFETVFWLQKNDIGTQSIAEVAIRRMGETINLSTVLKLYKTLVLVDDLNEGVDDLFKCFSENNKKGSKCIVTSHQKNIAEKNTYNLQYVSEEISRSILMTGNIKPSKVQLDKLINQISGYPLLLELAKNAVDNEEMTWDDVINESNITYINDTKKKQEFAQRVLGRYVPRFEEFFNLLLFLDATTVSKQFLKECGIVKYNAILAYSVFHETGAYQNQIHQLVLSAIKAVVGDKYDEDFCLNKLRKYLEIHTSKRDAGLYSFMAYHQNKVREVMTGLPSTDLFKHNALLAILYTGDTYSNHDEYLSLINTISLNPDCCYVDLVLMIERLEIEQNKVKKQFGENSDEYKRRINSDIEELNKLSSSRKKDKALVMHHIGKLKSFVGDLEGAEIDLLNALQLDPKSFHSMLRLARNYGKQNNLGKAGKYLEMILDTDPSEGVPISVRLSAYDIISNYKYKDLRKRFIDGRIKEFFDTLYAALAENYSHIYVMLAKLADHLSYNYPEYYTHLCARLPLPLAVERDARIKKDYGKILAAQYIYGNYKGDYNTKLFRSAEYYLSGIADIDDYIRKTQCKLYLAAELPEKALPIAKKIDDKDDKFMQQLISKVYLANGDAETALVYIEKTIAQENPDEKEYCAAFRHDKANCLYKLRNPKARDVMNEAIELQPNEKLKKEWSMELSSW